MSDNMDQRRTVLPPAEAEGAENFAAESGMDPTAGPGNDAVATEMETGTLDQHPSSSSLAEEGNRTGGEDAQSVIERRADSEEAVAAIEQEIDEQSIDQSADA
jgi:hypothetical protein